MKQVIVFLCILLLVVSVAAQAQLPSVIQQPATPLEKLLNPDGTIDTRSGFSGTLDPKGYRMVENPDGTPKFVRTYATAVASPGDVYWDDRFVYPGLQMITGQPDWGYSNAFTVSGTDLYVAGEFSSVNGNSANCIARWNGTTWDSVVSGPIFIYAIAVIGSDIYVGGGFNGASPYYVADFIQKWNGSAWSPLGLGVNGIVYDLAVSGTDLYVGGNFTLAGGASANRIAKWNGTNWVSLGSGVSGSGSFIGVRAIAISGSDVYVGGSFTTAGGISVNNIAKWNGATWDSLGNGIVRPSYYDGYYVYAIAIKGTDVYAGGAFTTAGGVPANMIAKWNGTVWDSLGSGVTGPVFSIEIMGSDIYIGGQLSYAGGKTANGIAKWNGTTWDSLGSGLTYSEYPGWASQMALIGSDLYVGGFFRRAGNVKTCSIAKWDGSDWSTVGIDDRKSAGVKGTVRAIERNGSDVYVGGDFLYTSDLQTNRIAKWNGTAWEKLGAGTPDPIYTGSVFAIAVSGTDVYIGGDLDNGYNAVRPNIAKWNGTTWDSLRSGTNSDVYVIKAIGTDIYVGGNFTSAGGIAGTNYIAKWDGSNWSALGTGMDGVVYAIDTLGGYLYAGGLFTNAGGNPAAYIAKWDGANWTPVGTGMNDFVRCMAISGSNLYIGGGFTTAGGVSANNIVKYDGATWTALGTGTNGWVRSVSINGSDLYAGGDFTTAGAVSANFIAIWDGSNWSALGSGVNQRVRAVCATENLLYAGGEFTLAGQKPSQCFGIWKTDSTSQAYSVTDGWNMVSVPVLANDFLKSSVYPTAVSAAFTYTGSYQSRDTLRNGQGYWAKFNGAGTVEYSGSPLLAETVDVRAGWNMIGSLSTTIPTSTITSIPGGMSVSPFFGYADGYAISVSLEPGRAYWVRANQAGQLVLSSTVSSSAVADRIRIVPGAELPPPGPGDEVLTSNAGSHTPQEFSLDQNYPNPFNPATSIRYQLPVTTQVTLRVYDLLGREIMTLVDGVQEAGYKSIVLDGSQYASGMYYYRLVAGNFTETRKMLLLK